MATAGHDFGPTANGCRRRGICLDYIRVIEDAFTAQAFITTDLDDNQITAFHPGAMQYAHLNQVSDAASRGIALGIVAPDGRQAMIEHAAQFAAAGIPFIFDPGQGLPMFGPEELSDIHRPGHLGGRQRLRVGHAAAKNRLDAQRHHRPRCEALIVTRGRRGVGDPHQGSARCDIPAVKPAAVVDPDRLRGRLPRWFNPRSAARSGLGDHRPDRLLDGGDQDRFARPAESPFHPRASSTRRYSEEFRPASTSRQ